MKYEVLEHKADLKIRAFGKTKEELFLNLMRGMFGGAKYIAESKSEKLERKISLESFDLPSLLVDFLSEILYLAETKKEVYQKIRFKELSDKKIKGTLFGKKLKRMGVQIKGVTYHDLEIWQRKDGIWQATVLFDI